ncbi:hypothetical protein D3C73_1516700 [compost metagenome]
MLKEGALNPGSGLSTDEGSAASQAAANTGALFAAIARSAGCADAPPPLFTYRMAVTPSRLIAVFRKIALFIAGFLCWWSDLVLLCPTKSVIYTGDITKI